ncbi:uncharacterized protein METZ01_LOCUS348237 [marine metagenome]|uniref:Uncharacterized protein n=1 Tax=marine metagenome TaxID=408172 RepID=A0A382RCF6_9ZZZZ
MPIVILSEHPAVPFYVDHALPFVVLMMTDNDAQPRFYAPGSDEITNFQVELNFYGVHFIAFLRLQSDSQLFVLSEY